MTSRAKRAANGGPAQAPLPLAADETLDVAALETWLWDAACAIRGTTDAPKFRDEQFYEDDNWNRHGSTKHTSVDARVMWFRRLHIGRRTRHMVQAPIRRADARVGPTRADRGQVVDAIFAS